MKLLAEALWIGLPILAAGLFTLLLTSFIRNAKRADALASANRIVPDRRFVWGMLVVTGAMVAFGLAGLAARRRRRIPPPRRGR